MKVCFSVSTTHWVRVTHICVGKLTIIGSDNDLSPRRRQAIIWTSAWIFLIGHLRINISELAIAFETFSFKKRHLKMYFRKFCLFGLGLNVLTLLTFFKLSNIKLYGCDVCPGNNCSQPQSMVHCLGIFYFSTRAFLMNIRLRATLVLICIRITFSNRLIKVDPY